MNPDNQPIFNSIPFNMEDLQFIYHPQFTIAVPREKAEIFKKNVYGAALAYTMGNKVDYTINKYSQNWNFNESSPIRKMILKLRKETKENISKIFSNLEAISNPENESMLVAQSALIRLEVSFRSAYLMLEMNHYFEAAAISRLILEQIGWIYSIHNLPGRKFLNESPTKSITKLKFLFPEVGHLYRYFSERAHIDPKHILKYIKFDNEKNVLNVKLTSDALSLIEAYQLFKLSDYFSIVSEITCNFKRGYRKVHIMKHNNTMIPNTQRSSLKKLIRINAKVNRLLQNINSK